MSLLTAPPDHDSIDDQARELRRLIARRSAVRELSNGQAVRKCRSLTVFSGKGGVGKSVVALNLASALARRGAAVCLLDAAPGIGNLGLLCGQNGYWNLAHVMAGTRDLDDVFLAGPGGIRIVPGADRLLQDESAGTIVSRALNELEQCHDWVIVDTAADALRHARAFVEAADCAVCVTTPEPTAVAASYSGLKSLAGGGDAMVSLLVNQADDEQQAAQILNRLRQAAQTFLGCHPGVAGTVVFDDTVRQSVARCEPLAEVAANGPAQLALERIADRLNGIVTRRHERGFFERLAASKARNGAGAVA